MNSKTSTNQQIVNPCYKLLFYVQSYFTEIIDDIFPQVDLEFLKDRNTTADSRWELMESLDIYKVSVLKTEYQETFLFVPFLLTRWSLYIIWWISHLFFFNETQDMCTEFHSNIDHTQICSDSVKQLHHVIWGKKLGLYFSILFTHICVGIAKFSSKPN